MKVKAYEVTYDTGFSHGLRKTLIAPNDELLLLEVEKVNDHSSKVNVDVISGRDSILTELLGEKDPSFKKAHGHKISRVTEIPITAVKLSDLSFVELCVLMQAREDEERERSR